jgi:hypothetical protein
MRPLRLRLRLRPNSDSGGRGNGDGDGERRRTTGNGRRTTDDGCRSSSRTIVKTHNEAGSRCGHLRLRLRTTGNGDGRRGTGDGRRERATGNGCRIEFSNCCENPKRFRVLGLAYSDSDSDSGFQIIMISRMATRQASIPDALSRQTTFAPLLMQSDFSLATHNKHR